MDFWIGILSIAFLIYVGYVAYRVASCKTVMEGVGTLAGHIAGACIAVILVRMLLYAMGWALVIIMLFLLISKS